MRFRLRSVVSFAVVVLLAGSMDAKNLPNIDAFGAQKGKPNNAAELAQKAGELARAGLRIQTEPRLGVPTVLWLSEKARLTPRGNAAERAEIAAARGYLGRIAHVYNLSAADVTSAVVDTVLNTGRGPVVVKFKQELNGIEIFREELNVVMNQQLDAVAVTGYITSQGKPARGGWSLPASHAADNAFKDSAPTHFTTAQFVKSFSREGYDYYTLASPIAGVSLDAPVRIKEVWFHDSEGLIPAYYVEVITSNNTGAVMLDTQVDESAYAYVISALNGSILFRKNLIDHAASSTPQTNLGPGGFTYRVWADPVTGIPYDSPAGNGVHPKLTATNDGAQHAFVAPQDVTLPNFPFSQNDPWLAPGSTETNGNNVDAWVNLIIAGGNQNTDGYGPTGPAVDPPTGDHRANVTASDQFLHTHQPDVDAFSASARQGSIVQLFYSINFLHDWFYDSGFTESMRNAQKNNFGRGGLQNDDIKAQSGDAASFNNANMLTPADGSRPRMRMYNFPNLANHLEITAPASIALKRSMGISMTGTRNFDVTGNIVRATFTSGPTTCTITNAAALAGNIAMFDFDNTDGTGCSFSTRITRIHATSATAALMVYTSGAANSVANITGLNTTHTKPIGVISWNGGQAIKTELAVPNTVTGRMLRVADRDGSLDTQIVFHEWGHYVSNRLIGNAAGLNNNQGGAMGEGWGDFTAMMLTVRESDTANPTNANWDGVYAIATYAASGAPFTGALNHGYYRGIRRGPYSTNMASFNGLTFRHIMDGQALPTTTGFTPNTAVNSQVHNSGEVWATMLWECYASLLRDTLGATPRLTFQQAQDRMKQYYIASLAMTPSSPTYLEARDAVLAAAAATDLVDYQLFLQAFAKRGAGINAVAPDRWSFNHAGVVESFDALPNLRFAGTTLDDSAASCDNDGTLDSGEAGKLTVKIKNTGSTALTGTVASISSSTPGVSFPGGTTISFPASDPLDEVTGSVTVAYAGGISGIQVIDFQIDVYDPAIGVPRTQTPGFRANVAPIPASSATDDVEAPDTAWTLDSDPALGQTNPWKRVILQPLDREWHVDNAGDPSDQRLLSPVFTVTGSGSVNLQFDHTWAFEGGAFDGGVIEMQVNSGAWTDVGGPAYNGTLVTSATNLNPLKGRPAFINSGSGHVSLTQAVAPGSTVRVRFRFGSDNAIGAPGWNLDNIAFTGVAETPFNTITGDPGCVIGTTTTLTTSANPSPFGSNLTLTATVSSTGGTPAGNVTFFDGAANLGTVALVNGVATLTTSSLSIGAHSLTASYAGGPGFAPSMSGAYAQTISKISTSVSTISSLNPSNVGQSVTFTATVSASSGTPTGSVVFYDGATPLATVAMAGGVASYTTSTLSGGTHTITGSYSGSSTYAGSSGSVVQNVVTGSTIAFNPASYWKHEDGGVVTLTVTRTGGDTSGSATVQYETVSGTATGGVQFVADSGTITFGPSETSKTFNITLNDNSDITGKVTFTVALSNPNAAVLGASVATVDIMDDDTAESDFSAPLDGKNDLVFRNETTGDTRVYQLNGTSFVSSADLLQFGGNWRLVGVADFNADGKADLLYRNISTFAMVVWYMNGTSLSSTANIMAVTDSNWQPVAVGDITGDGYPDIIWRHATTFTTAVWVMRENVRLSVYTLPVITDANWQVKGLGDFNRDGNLDIVWMHGPSYTVAIWHMTTNGTVRASITTVSPSTGSPWQLVGVGDMNNDGDSDVIWQASTTRTVAVWLMNQNVRSSIAVISPTIADPNWGVAAPR